MFRPIARVAVALIASALIVAFYAYTPAVSPQKIAPYAWGGWERKASTSQWTCLTAALYWEGALDESQAGLRAIAWQIRNRVSSRDFPRNKKLPHTICGVVTDGYRPGRRTGCQYAFVCNGTGESPYEFCRIQDEKMKQHLSLAQCKARWVRYSRIAAAFLKNPGSDPTRGATHYWAASIDDPRWVKTDIAPDSIIQIDSHKFGWSRFLGEDVPRRAASE
jgi:spore germination cell wall hydrolase CwlJ-like protein